MVWFGESIKQEVWKEAVKQSMTCDAMIIVGTSLVVSPANTLHFYAKNNQVAIVDINPENTPFSYEMDFSIRQTAVVGLSRLMSSITVLDYNGTISNKNCSMWPLS